LKGIAENLGAQLVSERCQQIMRASDEALARELSRLLAELSAQMLIVAEQSRREAAHLSQTSTNTNTSTESPGKAPGPESA
jgi:two-component system sensor histidine kinase RpfC